MFHQTQSIPDPFALNFEDIWSEFYKVVGLADDTHSRIQSLRKIMWDKGNDSFFQSLGYTVDLFMNTGYNCYLYLFNIWILFNVSDPFELLGSVIFFEFLINLDEEIVETKWWDDGKRFLKTGIVSCIMQNTIRRDITDTCEKYLEKMGKTMSPTEIDQVRNLLNQEGLWGSPDFLHGQEMEGEMLLTISERVERLRQAESKKTLRDRYDDSSSAKPAVHFGFMSSERPLFERHHDLRSWYQWEVV